MKNTLRIRRAERDGMSQMAVARALGMSFNRFWRIEVGETEPTPDEMQAMADYFGCSITKLFPGSRRKAVSGGVQA